MACRRILEALVLVMIASGAAGAGTLATAPLPGGSDYRCQAVNVGKRATEIDLAIFASNSGSIALVSCMGVLPGHVCTVTGTQFSSYCRVTFKGSRNGIRAALTALNGGVATAAVPAQ